jgi:hypothetical protein
MAIQGRHALRGRDKLNLAPIELKNVPPQGSLLVEFWYRNWMGFPVSRDDLLRVVASVRNDKGQKVSEADVWPACTYGQWQKASLRLERPPSANGSLVFEAFCGAGVLELDNIVIAHVSDQDEDRLRRFIEGADPQ